MSSFEINGKFELNNEDVTVESAAEILRASLLKNYSHWKMNDKFSLEELPKKRAAYRAVRVAPTGVIVHSTFKTFWDKGGVTDADVKIEIKDNVLSYGVSGAWSFNWQLSVIYLGFGIAFGITLPFLIANIITFVTSRDRSKLYFEEAFKTLEHELRAVNVTKKSTKAIDNKSINEKLKELQSLLNDALISESDYNLKKTQLLESM